jgi:hypothetical protein
MESNGVDQERLLGLEAAEQSGLKQRTWAELKLMWRIAFPSILARVTSFGMIVVTQSFIGHVGELQLASYALVQSLILRFSNGILVSHYYMFYFMENCIFILKICILFLLFPIFEKYYILLNPPLVSKA